MGNELVKFRMDSRSFEFYLKRATLFSLLFLVSCAQVRYAYVYRIDSRKGEDKIGAIIEDKVKTALDRDEGLFSASILQLEDGTRLKGSCTGFITYKVTPQPPLRLDCQDADPDRRSGTGFLFRVDIRSTLFRDRMYAYCFTHVMQTGSNGQDLPDERLESGIILTNTHLSGLMMMELPSTPVDYLWGQVDSIHPQQLALVF